MNHLRRQFPVWGTIVDVDCYSQFVSDADLNLAMKQITDFCEAVDRDFSTYKADSWITRLR
jgi:thiamine biosynthesis lipoprotein